MLNEFLALLKSVAALVTVLLLRFLSPPELWSSLDLLPKRLVEENFLSRTGSASAVSVCGADDDVSVLEDGSGSDFSFGGLEEALNILFSNPPWLEKLNRLFPASLIVDKRFESIV